MVETIRDVKNNLLSRREITCTFKGLAGKLKKLEAIDIVSKQYNLDGKVIVPIMLKNDTGRPMISGTFYVYDDEKLARAHIKPAIFKRLEKAKGGSEKTEGEAKEAVAEKETKEKPAEKKKEASTEKKEAPAEKKEAKAPEKKETKDAGEKKEKPVKKESFEPKEKTK